MTSAGWLIFLLVAAALLLLAEFLLPAHGSLGAFGVLCLLAAVGLCYRINPWAAVALLLALVAVMPFAWSAAVRIWPRTPVGRRVLLPPVPDEEHPLEFQLGQVGVAISELRPMGECELGGQRVAARADAGIIAAGTRVIVVSADGRTAAVRALAQTEREGS
jgi:membrane protein implicated in regulation of membrane protease activity